MGGAIWSSTAATDTQLASTETVVAPRVPRLSIVGHRTAAKSLLQDALTRGFVTESPWEGLEPLLVPPAEKATVEYCGLTVDDVPKAYGPQDGRAAIEEYIEKFGLAHSDCVAFVYTEALGEAMGRCAELLVEESQQKRTDRRAPPRVFLVKIKVDVDVGGDGGDAAQAGLDSVRKEACEELSAMGLQRLENNMYVFLFSGDLQQAFEGEGTSPRQGEWQRFKQAVFEAMPSVAENVSNRGWDNGYLKDILLKSFMPLVDVTLPSEAIKDKKLADFLEMTKAECEKREVPTLSIVGPRGVGKSTILNSLRGLGPKDPGARPVGAKECTHGEAEEIQHCGLLLRDVPGADGSLVRATMGEEYIREFELDKSDGILFIFTGVFNKAMGDCAKILHEKHERPVYLIRNKADEDCRNDVKDGNFATHQAAFESIQERTVEEVCKADLPMFASDKYIFLISARIEETRAYPPEEPWQSDWHRLEQAVFTSIKDEAKKATVSAILSGNATELAKLRRRECEALVFPSSCGGETGTESEKRNYQAPERGLVLVINPFNESVILADLLVKFMRIFALNITGPDDPLRESKSLIARMVLERTWHCSVQMQACAWVTGAATAAFVQTGVFAAIGVAIFAVGMGCSAGLRWYHIRSFGQEVIPKLAQIAEKIYLVELRTELSAVDRRKNMIRDVEGLSGLICDLLGAQATGEGGQATKCC